MQFPCSHSCGRTATVAAKHCADTSPTLLCDECLAAAKANLTELHQLERRATRHIVVCACHRPVLDIDNHIEVCRLP